MRCGCDAGALANRSRPSGVMAREADVGFFKRLLADKRGAMAITASHMFLGSVSIGIGLMRGTDSYAAFHHETNVGHANYGASKLAHDHSRSANVVVNQNVVMTAIMGPRMGVESDNITMDGNAMIACPQCPYGMCKVCIQYKANKPRAIIKQVWVRAKQQLLWSALGMYSLLMLLPDRHAGFVVLINGDGDAARTMLGEVLLKHFTAPAERATIAGYAARVAAEPVTRGQAAPDVSVREPVAVDELRTRLGIWRDPWFGEAALCEEAGRVRFRAGKSPLLSGIVMRSLGRTLVAWDDVRVDAEAWIDLPADADEGMLKLAKVDPRADFSFDFEDLAFRRVRDCD